MDRRRLESTLDRVVSERRFTIAVVFPIVGATLFLASHRGLLPDWLAFDPLLVAFGTLVMRSPLVAGLAPLVDRRAALALLVATGYTYAVEWTGVATGVPYGRFVYGLDLGPMLFGTIPVALPIFFLPLVVNASLLALVLLGDRAAWWGHRVALAVGLVLGIDVVLDPAAVSLGFWHYLDPGAYYGVPLSNFAGWLLSGAIVVGIVEVAFDWRDLRDRLAVCPYLLDDLVSFVLLWGLVNAGVGNWIPVALAVLLLVGLVRADRFDVAVPTRPRRA